MTGTSSDEPRSLSREDFERDVIRRARADASFKQQLLADPKAALHAAYGIELPPEVQIQALEETPSRFYLVLPVAAAEALTDEQLGAVAGGVLNKIESIAPRVTAEVAPFAPFLYAPIGKQ